MHVCASMCELNVWHTMTLLLLQTGSIFVFCSFVRFFMCLT